MNSTSKSPPGSNFHPQSETGSLKSSPVWSPPGRPTTAVDTPSQIKIGSSPSPKTSAKTELDLLAEALQRLDQQYRDSSQHIDRQLIALSAQLEILAKNVNTLRTQAATLATQVADLALQLKRLGAG